MNNGRLEIFTDIVPTGDIEKDKKILPIILDNALSTHSQNVSDIEVLRDYYYNETDIKLKEKIQQPKINNKVAIPYANIAVTTINSYCFSTPFSRNSRSSSDDITQMIKALNDALDDDNYDSKTAKAELNSGICGLGYRFVRPANPEERSQGIWFKTTSDLDPEKTFVVKSNGIDKEKVVACTFYTRKKYNDDGNFKQETVYNVYTKYHHWIFTKGDDVGPYNGYGIERQLFESKYVLAYPLVYKKIPIIEYQRKQDRTGDFEISKGIIDAINNLASSRVDDVQQAVDYILLLRDIACETDDDLKKITKAVANGILAFRSIEGIANQPSVEVLNTKINQSEVQTLQDFLCNKVEEALNIPSRETRGSSGDTGLAVESRAGYRSLENIAGLITLCAKQAENETLDVILAICSKMNDCPFKDLKVKDIEIKANRNKVENVTTASTAYSTLISAGMNDEDALSITQIAPDPIGTASRNKKAKEEAEERSVEIARQQANIENDNEQNNSETNNSENK